MSGLREWLRDGSLPAHAGEPGLAALPPEEVLALVRAHLLTGGAAAPLSAQLRYARWKPGVSVSLGYGLRWPDGSERWVSVKRYANDKPLHLLLRQSGRVAAADGLPGCGFAVLPGAGLALACLPFDRELPGIARVLDLRRTARRLNDERLFGDRRVRAHRSRARLLRYKPERRAVFRLDVGLKTEDGGRETTALAVRVLPPAVAARVAAMRRACGDAGPRLLLAEERTGLLHEEWLDVDVPAPDRFGHAGPAGAALAALHAMAAPGRLPDGPAAPSPEAPLGDLSPLFAWHPDLRAAARGLPQPAPAGVVRWTHGDFHPDQVGLERGTGRTRLLDFDALGPGDPADDLASWIADHLAADPAATLQEACSPLLRGYAAGGGRAPDEPALAAAVSVALVRRAAAAVRRLQADAVVTALRLLARADALRGTPARSP